jgi:hypothetical protein
MRSCEQMENLNVLEHGFMVAKKFLELYNHIHNNTPLKSEWKLPEWIYNKSLWDMNMSLKEILTYQIYHDCGKPFCLEIDDEGKRHFPNHAEVSANVWSAINSNNSISDCILHDMEIHTIKDAGVPNFAKLTHWNTLLITGLCEVHANADMFGGIESTSFKIKWKQINKRAKKILTIKEEK